MTPTLVLVYLLGVGLIGEMALDKGATSRQSAIIGIFWPIATTIGIIASLIMGDR